MNAALALVFLACVTGSMAADARSQVFGQLVQQGQAVVQAVLGQLQQQVLQIVQQAVGQLSSLVGSMGRLTIDVSNIPDQVRPIVGNLINQVLVQLLGGLQGILGGRASVDLGAIFSGFLSEIQGALTGIGQHFLNQGLAAVLGGIAGSRGISDIFASISGQVAAAVAAAQGALSGTLTNLTALGSSLVDASKPHLAQLQEQLVGHGLNVLGSLSETINNLHGSITGGN